MNYALIKTILLGLIIIIVAEGGFLLYVKNSEKSRVSPEQIEAPIAESPLSNHAVVANQTKQLEITPVKVETPSKAPVKNVGPMSVKVSINLPAKNLFVGLTSQELRLSAISGFDHTPLVIPNDALVTHKPFTVTLKKETPPQFGMLSLDTLNSGGNSEILFWNKADQMSEFNLDVNSASRARVWMYLGGLSLDTLGPMAPSPYVLMERIQQDKESWALITKQEAYDLEHATEYFSTSPELTAAIKAATQKASLPESNKIELATQSDALIGDTITKIFPATQQYFDSQFKFSGPVSKDCSTGIFISPSVKPVIDQIKSLSSNVVCISTGSAYAVSARLNMRFTSEFRYDCVDSDSHSDLFFSVRTLPTAAGKCSR